MYKNNADKLLNQKSVPFCQLPIFLRKILANKTALFLYRPLPCIETLTQTQVLWKKYRDLNQKPS